MTRQSKTPQQRAQEALDVEERRVKVWVEPVYRTVTEKVWVDPTFRMVTDRVWQEPVVRIQTERVFIPDRYETRTYFRTNGACAFGEDHSALLGVEQYGLQENMMWANDFPHHEGTWPHSAQAVERMFGQMKEQTRANLLGLNAARFFGFDVPEALK